MPSTSAPRPRGDATGPSSSRDIPVPFHSATQGSASALPSAPAAARPSAGPRAPRITGVGIGATRHAYSQPQLLELFQVRDERIRSIFLNSAIRRRRLTLPPVGPDGQVPIETQGELLRKHREVGLRMAEEAIRASAEDAGADLGDIGYLCCVSSTGLLTPGFSALLIDRLGLSRRCARLDVVGMGCNAGLNALNAVACWAAANPGRTAVMACIEVCSAAYVFDGTLRTSVVNSLFGDGAAAVCVRAGTDRAQTDGAGRRAPRAPAVLRHSSLIIPEHSAAMRYDWDDEQGKFSFYLDPRIPYVVGAHAEAAVGELLAGTGLGTPDIAHWVVHAGGKKVVDSVRVNLRLTRHDVRHTTAVLAEYGNVSSGSFLFSYRRLCQEGAAAEGDYGVLMTMGPGSTIETALLRW